MKHKCDKLEMHFGLFGTLSLDCSQTKYCNIELKLKIDRKNNVETQYTNRCCSR